MRAMVKSVRRVLKSDDSIFRGGVQVFRPLPPSAAKASRLLDSLKQVGDVKRGTVEESLYEQLERGELPKR